MSRTFHRRREERKPKRERDGERAARELPPAEPAGRRAAVSPKVLAKGIVNGYLYLLDDANLSPAQHLLVGEQGLTGRELERRIAGARRRLARGAPLALETLLGLGLRRVVPAACWRREGRGWVVDAPPSTAGLFSASERLTEDPAWVDGYVLAVDAGQRLPGFDYYVVPGPIAAEQARAVFADALAHLMAEGPDDGSPARAQSRRLAEQIGRAIGALGGRACTARVCIEVGRDQQIQCEDLVRLGVGTELDFVELAEQYAPQRFYRGRW